MKNTKKELLKRVEELDKTLKLIADLRKVAKTPEDQKKCIERIDAVLDERILLMNERDSKKN